MKETTDPDVLKYLKSKHQQAYILIENIKQRRNTLLRLTKKIADKQHQYLLHSDQWLTKEIAQKNNIQFSRRTIAKYRELEGIPSTHERRY